MINFYTPLYTLPLIKAMPASSTNVIKNDNISSSAISELNSNKFTYFSNNNNALNDFTSNVITYNPLPYKAIHNSKN